MTVFNVRTNGSVAQQLRPKRVGSVFVPELHRGSIRVRVKQLNAHASSFSPSPSWRELLCLSLAKRFTRVPHSGRAIVTMVRRSVANLVYDEVQGPCLRPRRVEDVAAQEHRPP